MSLDYHINYYINISTLKINKSKKAGKIMRKIAEGVTAKKGRAKCEALREKFVKYCNRRPDGRINSPGDLMLSVLMSLFAYVLMSFCPCVLMSLCPYVLMMTSKDILSMRLT